MCLWPSGNEVPTGGVVIFISRLIVRYRVVAGYITIIMHH